MGTVFSDYVPRSPDAPQGPDYFFVAEENLFLLPVANGAAPAPDSLRRSERWRIAEEQVAGMFTDGGEWAKAILCFARLGQTWPDTARHAFNLGVAYARSGRTDEAGRWLNRADSLVGSPPRDGRGYLSALPQ